MSNLVKSRNIVCDNNDKKVIDYNELISQKILKIQENLAKDKNIQDDYEFVEGLDAQSVEQLLTDDIESPEIDENAKNKANEIIALANSDAKAIVERAKEESDLIRQDSAKQGREEGYLEGKRQAQEECDLLKQAIEEEKTKMEIEYNDKLNEMEPMLVETILKVFEKVTHVLSEDKKDLVLCLVNDVLSKTELSREFLIRVSDNDYKFMLDNRDKITGVVSKKVQIEIIEDPVLKAGQCMIESDSGIYDCSLDIQLSNLISNIKAMACLVND